VICCQHFAPLTRVKLLSRDDDVRGTCFLFVVRAEQGFNEIVNTCAWKCESLSKRVIKLQYDVQHAEGFLSKSDRITDRVRAVILSRC